MIKGLQRLLLVQDSEAGKVSYFLVFFLLVSAGMAIGRGTADALFLKRLGIEYLPLMYMGQSFVLAMVSLAYAAFADRIVAERFFRIIFLLLLLLVFSSWLIMTMTASSLAYPFYYLVYEIASEVLLVHTALYINQNMTTLQAKRLTPLLFGGAQAGTIVGGLMLAFVAPVTGPKNLLLAWCLLLIASTVLLFGWHSKQGPSRYYRAPSRSRQYIRECAAQITQGIRYTWSSALLRASSAALFFMVVAFYVLSYSVNRVYVQTFPTEAELAGFFGMLTAATSALALLMQLFVTNRVIDKFGVRRVNLLFPLTTVAALGGLAGSFTLPFALLGSLNKDALMPAFRNPVRTLFANVIPGYMQGRARAISVAVVLPAAMFVGGLMLWIMQQLENPVYFLLPGMLSALLYLFFNTRMNHAYASTLISTLKERLFLPKDRMYAGLSGSGKTVSDEISRGIHHEDPDVAVAFSRLLVESFPQDAAVPIIARAGTADTATADRLLKLLSSTDLTTQQDRLHELMSKGDAHFQATIIRLMTDQNMRTNSADVGNLLESSNPRLCATGIHAALGHANIADIRRSIEKWTNLLAGDINECHAAFDIMTDVEQLDDENRAMLEAAYREAFARLLMPGEQNRTRTLRAISRWQAIPGLDLRETLVTAMDDSDPDLREAAAACIHHLDTTNRTNLFLQAAGDSHPRVRKAAVTAAGKAWENYEEAALELLQGNRGNPRAQRVLLESLFGSAIPPSEFGKIAVSRADEAQRLQQAVHTLNNTTAADSDARSITAIALQERLEQTIQLALLALEPMHEPGLIQTISAGFASQDERHIANASEALTTLDCDYASALLDKVLQKTPHKHATGHGQPFNGSKDVLEWCARQTDEWLNECASHALQQLYPEGSRG
ncbi:MAG: MFS transporter [Pseudomonadota bacterium]